MMRSIDNPPREKARRNGLCKEKGAASHRRITPRSAARTIRDDTSGTPGAFRPWTNCRPNQGRCANEENARVFHQGPDTLIVHQEAGYIDAALHLLVHRVTRRRCTEGWVHISFCAQAHLIPAHSGLLQPKFQFSLTLGPRWPQ